jgi:hypothetical protein
VKPLGGGVTPPGTVVDHWPGVKVGCAIAKLVHARIAIAIIIIFFIGKIPPDVYCKLLMNPVVL